MNVEVDKRVTFSSDNKYDVTSGNIVDVEIYPTLGTFKIPNSKQTTNMILNELIQMKC